MKLLRKLFYTGCFSIALTSSAVASEMALCQHEERDSAALRAQAARPVHWRNLNARKPVDWVQFKILGINDFHGQLEPSSLFGSPVGGAEVLASYLRAETKESSVGAFIVHAGDHVGASPPASALLQDEPSISFLNLLSRNCDPDNKLAPRCNLVGTLGNHEFDEGVDEMLRLLNGGNHADGPFLEDEYGGARFPYVNANVVYKDGGEPVLPPYVIKKVRGQSVAFIGAVLKDTPTIVTPSGVAGVEFLDEADAINSYVPELLARGVRAIVVTIHEGARQSFNGGPTPEEPQDLSGAIGDIVNRLDDEVDIVISGHAHGFTNQLVENQNGHPILVTQAFSRGSAYADIDVAIDPQSGDIVQKSASIITTWANQTPGTNKQKDVASLVSASVNAVAPLVNEVIGIAASAITREETAAGESALGNLIADAQRHAMGTEVAFMNPGGIRADMEAGEVTWGELFTIQPFNNDLVKMDLTGTQILALLEQQWLNQSRPRVLKTSGIEYTWDAGQPDGSKVIPDSVLVNGIALDENTVYSLTVNSFIAGGGDNFSVLTEGDNRVVGPVDLDALISFIQNLEQPFSATTEGRIQVLD